MNKGLKLWSTNDYYIEEARKLYESGIYEYIELYTVPNSFYNFIKYWKELKIPFILHAPHYQSGINWGIEEKRLTNIKLFLEVEKYFDLLKPKYIIIHPGVNGTINEIVNQIDKLPLKEYILIENKPKETIFNVNYVCNGHTPEEIKFIYESTGIGFCLDIGHAICAANSLKYKPLEYINKFMQLYPKICHLSDGDINSVYDSHENLGFGNYPLNDILNIINKIDYLTIETNKNGKKNLNCFKKDVFYLNKILKRSSCVK